MLKSTVVIALATACFLLIACGVEPSAPQPTPTQPERAGVQATLEPESTPLPTLAPPGPTATPTLEPTPTATAIPTPTATPVPLERISAEELWAEREKNATRFDDTYKGRRVEIYGLVGEIDGGEVRLVVDLATYHTMRNAGIDFPLVEYIALHDLPRAVQASVDKGEVFQAVCTIESFIILAMNLGDCRDGQVVDG